MNNEKNYSVVIDKELVRCDMEGCNGFSNDTCNYTINGTEATCKSHRWFRVSRSPPGQPGPVVSKFQYKS